MPAASATYVIELTPAGRGAVAVVLVAGPNALRSVDECFTAASSRQVAEARAGRIMSGRWGGEAGEELIVCRRDAERIEIHCHGGVAAVRAVVDALCCRGCEPMHWQQWLSRTDDDPFRAAAQIALASASTSSTAAILLDQCHGALKAAIDGALDAVRNGDWEAASDVFDSILAHRAIGLRLITPWHVVIAGAPNVGKSSLMNALVGYQRAIVCDLPGTTRDVVAADTAIDGWPVRFSDTAGLRETRDQLEAAGIERANTALANADLVLQVQDVNDSASESVYMSDCISHGTPVIRVLNKIDLLPNDSGLTDGYGALTSALTCDGIPALIATIGRTLVPSPPAPGTAVPFTQEQIERLEAARATAIRQDTPAITASLAPLLSPK
jgi:tRNA modification GTPase